MHFIRRSTIAWLGIGLLVLGFPVSPVLAYVIPTKGFPKLEVSGNSTLSLNLHDVQGAQSVFNDDNYGYEKPLTNSSNLFITGEVAKDLHLNASVAADPYSTSQTRWNLRYDGNDAKVLVGEFNATMTENDLVKLNRSLKGVQVDAVLPKGQLSALASTLDAPVRTDTIYGRNVSGPYYLTATPIVDGSEIVRVNNVRKERMKDYTIDYQNGILNFNSGTIVSPSDQITVSYEQSVNGIGGGQLTGVRAAYPINEKLTAGVTHLQMKANVRGDSIRDEDDQFTGNNTPGPFYLASRPVVPESEVVTINTSLQARNIAYTLDATTGRLLFKSGYEPPHGSTIIVKYQVAIAGGKSNDRAITGVDVNYRVNDALNVNMQVAKSDGPTDNDVPATKYDNEQIAVQLGMPLTAQTFHLRHVPIQPSTESLFIGLVKLNAGVDYTVNYTTGELHVLRDTFAVPPAAPFIVASYTTAQQTQHLKGDSAMQMRADYTTNKLTASMRYRKVDPGFSPMETVDYRRTESELEWAASYAASEALTLSTTGTDSRVPYNAYASGANQVMMNERTRSFNADYRLSNGLFASLQRNSLDSKQVADGRLGTSNITDSLSMSWLKDTFSASLNLNRTTNDSRQLRYSDDPYQPLPEEPSATDEIFDYRGTTNNAALNLSYQPNEKLNVGVNLAANKISATTDGEATKTGGNSVNVNAFYKPAERVTLTANLQTNKTDASTTAGGGVAPALTSRNMNLGADWQVSDKLSLGVNLTNDRYAGDEYSNSASNTVSGNARWQATEKIALNGYASRQQLRYLDESGRSTNNMVGLSGEVGPIGKARISLDAQRIWGTNSSSVTQFMQTEGQAHRAVPAATDIVGTQISNANALTMLAGKISYPVANRHSIYLRGETTQGSGFPNDSQKNAVGLGWEYQVSDNLTLTLDAQRVSYTDKGNADSNYNANQLNAQLAWHF